MELFKRTQMKYRLPLSGRIFRRMNCRRIIVQGHLMIFQWTFGDALNNIVQSRLSKIKTQPEYAIFFDMSNEN
ncbi:unnamed protein product [Paramecium octaurelia]|uniref:Uncharacterized protein n=1 Tax=Paramecium octaurelia TaxID=43137 RepID=A0A8S1YL27_PAROT|nr:unnamed protein product [Paramecium octaurelia]